MLDASANVIAFLIQNVAIAHPKEAECRFARRLKTIEWSSPRLFLSPSE
jgi:hypothetical protein